MKYDKEQRRLAAQAAKMKHLEAKYDEEKERREHLETVLATTMHEVRRFSGELSSHLETLSKTIADNRMKEIAETAYFTSGMLTARLAFTDIELNPSAVQSQARLRSGVYKKFEKASHVLGRHARRKQMSIRFNGPSYHQFDALLAFEMVPFVVLDNAIKYSPECQNIDVEFDETQNRLDVVVSSMGPMLDDDELEQIFARGGRSRRALASSIPGDGLGLYLVQTLCALHGITVSASSSTRREFQMNGIDYSTFRIKFSFRRP